jgi:Asp-tRNA(Asn)/Glu-tRNA(Gln) amidotransferase C subunit
MEINDQLIDKLSDLARLQFSSAEREEMKADMKK